MRPKIGIYSSGATLLMTTILSCAAMAQDAPTALRDISNQQVNERQLREAVSSRTLTWLTGSSSNNDYISVGRTANFFGFVALRVSSGQSLTRSAVAQDTLSVLNSAQRDQLIALLSEQNQAFLKVQTARHKMNRALEGLLVGEVLSRNEFLELGRTYGASEAELGRVIGQELGNLAQTLTSEQKTDLAEIRAAHVSGRGDQIARPPARLKLPREDKQELVNLTSRFLSWTTGSQEFNDFEVVGKPSQHFGFVSLRIESNHGVKRGSVAKEVWAMMTPDQQQILNVAAAQNAAQFGEFLEIRGQLMRTLEVALSGATIDTQQVEKLGSMVGEVEASMTWAQATAMLGVRDSLSEDQSSQLLAMRAKYTGASQEIATADPIERGRQLFAQCALCHIPKEGVTVGPNLDGIVGNKIAGDANFTNYSPALRSYAEQHGTWNEAFLDMFLQSPRSLVPGTIMGFDGLEAKQDRSALIAYLKTRE